MYSLFVSLAIALLIGGGGMLADFWGIGWAIAFGVIAGLVSFVLVLRRLSARLQPAMQRVQKQMEAQLFDAALQSMRDMLPMGRWVPLLRGSLMAQMGVLAFHRGQTAEAIELLSHASRRAGDAQMLLASILYQKGDKDRAFRTLEVAALVNKRHAMLHNLYAWLLHKEGRVDEAMAKLARHLKKEPGSGAAKDNLLRLQNKQRLSMKDFGLEWYALGFERPPASMGQMQTVRKGFRTPPKRKGG